MKAGFLLLATFIGLVQPIMGDGDYPGCTPLASVSCPAGGGGCLGFADLRLH